MRIEVECRKSLWEPTVYGTPYKTYREDAQNIVVHIKRREVKKNKVPDNFRLTIEWDEQ